MAIGCQRSKCAILIQICAILECLPDRCQVAFQPDMVCNLPTNWWSDFGQRHTWPVHEGWKSVEGRRVAIANVCEVSPEHPRVQCDPRNGQNRKPWPRRKWPFHCHWPRWYNLSQSLSDCGVGQHYATYCNILQLQDMIKHKCPHRITGDQNRLSHAWWRKKQMVSHGFSWYLIMFLCIPCKIWEYCTVPGSHFQ